MNNITLNASNEMDLKFADCFRGCRTACLDDLVGQYLCEYYNRVEFVTHIPKENEFLELQQITLDLDKVQPCIYTAMKHGLRVEVEFNNKGFWNYTFIANEAHIQFAEDWHNNGGIKSVKLLDMKVGEG
tara:strand:- start:1095 stop:1481 length:387 start_codon:yes stop_codon:yes gene_type:complete